MLDIALKTPIWNALYQSIQDGTEMIKKVYQMSYDDNNKKRYGYFGKYC